MDTQKLLEEKPYWTSPGTLTPKGYNVLAERYLEKRGNVRPEMSLGLYRSMLPYLYEKRIIREKEKSKFW